MTLEEALAVATVDDGPVDDVIKIDAQNKTILLPASEMLFGVEGEKDVERKYFKCTRIVGDGIDLYNHQIYVNYVSAENKNGTFPPDIPSTPYWCDDVALDETGNYITFSWLLSGNVLTHPGFIAFAIVAKYVDGEALKTRWKTTPAIGTVLMTVPDSGQSVAEMYPDVITQLLQRMAEVEGIATPEAMQNYVNAWLQENGVIDETLTQENKAAPASVVGELKSDLINVNNTKADKTDLAKTNLYLDALYKLNRGQTYDVLEQESEAYSVDVPSGAKYAGVDMVGGKSVVWNQICPEFTSNNFVSLNNTSTTIEGNTVKFTTNMNYGGVRSKKKFDFYINHKYLVTYELNRNTDIMVATSNAQSIIATASPLNVISTVHDGYLIGRIVTATQSENSYIFIWDMRETGFDEVVVKNLKIHDLTLMFGAGNEPETVEEFEAMFPNDYYEYCEPTIISSQTDRVNATSADSTVTQQITIGFPTLNSAGSVYDYIDLNEGKLHQRVGVVGLWMRTWNQQSGIDGLWTTANVISGIKLDIPVKSVAMCICSKYVTKTAESVYSGNVGIAIHSNGRVWVYDSSYTSSADFRAAMNGVMLYYELAEEVITDITIPTELSDWLTVEVGGSITFHNTDEGKRLLIPNKETFIRKLDEVIV